MIHVITVPPESGQLEIRTYQNLDENDSSGTCLAEAEFINAVKKHFPSAFLDEDNCEKEEEINAILDNGYYEEGGYQFYLIHSYAENIQR